MKKKYPDGGKECLQRNRLREKGQTRADRYYSRKRRQEEAIKANKCFK